VLHHHSVYVVELSQDVLNEPRFRRANPTYNLRKPCVYVGMTGLSPDERTVRQAQGRDQLQQVRAGVWTAAVASVIRGIQPRALRSGEGNGGRVSHRIAGGRLRGVAGIATCWRNGCMDA
jgi:hypothetical protein